MNQVYGKLLDRLQARGYLPVELPELFRDVYRINQRDRNTLKEVNDCQRRSDTPVRAA